MKIDEASYRIISNAMEALNKNYDIIWIDKDIFSGYIEEDEILDIIEDLVYEIDHLNEKYEDLENDLKDNYKPISKAEQYGVSDSDFI